MKDTTIEIMASDCGLGLDQVTSKQYLQKNVFPKLEIALNTLLDTIEKNGEFESYVEMLADREEKERRELRRRERERKRLAEGDAYVTETESDLEDEDDYNSEDYYSETSS